MVDRRRGKPYWHRSIRRAVVLLAVCTGFTGCIGPSAVRHTRMRYNEVMRSTNDEQLLMNIVRLRYADSPVFVDLPNITSQFEMAGRGYYLGGYGNQAKGPASLGYGELSLRDTPTLSYHPREGREIAKALLTPLSADLFIVVNAGSNLEELLTLTINDINDVPNAPRATTLLPQVPEDNSLCRRGIQLLSSLRDRDGTELVFGTKEDSDSSSDAIPRSAIGGATSSTPPRTAMSTAPRRMARWSYASGRRSSTSGFGRRSSIPPRCGKWRRSSNSSRAGARTGSSPS